MEIFMKYIKSQNVPHYLFLSFLIACGVSMSNIAIGTEYTVSTNGSIILESLKSFPTAYGPGASAVGGRGGDVYVVTNLSDSGPGSFREGVIPSAEMPWFNENRTIIFNVGGKVPVTNTFLYSTDFENNVNVTIAGQSAPTPFVLEAQDAVSDYTSYSLPEWQSVISRYITTRFQPDRDEGDETRIVGYNANTIILDHLTSAHGAYAFSTLGLSRRTIDPDPKQSVQFCLGVEGIDNHNVSGVLGYEYSNIVFQAIQSSVTLTEQTGREKYDSIHYQASAHFNAFVLIDHRQPAKTYGGANSIFTLKHNYTYDWGYRLGSAAGSMTRVEVGNVYERGQNGERNDYGNGFKNTLHKVSFDNYHDNDGGNGAGTFPINYIVSPKIYAAKNRVYDEMGSLVIDDSNQHELFSLHPADPAEPQFVVNEPGIYSRDGRSTWHINYNIAPNGPIPSRYFIDALPPSLAHSPPDIDVSKVKDMTLTLSGAGFRIEEDGSTFNISELDRYYTNIAKNKTDRNITGIGSSNRIYNLNFNFSDTVRPVDFDSDTVTIAGVIDYVSSNANPGFGLPDAWQREHDVTDRNAVKVNWVFGNMHVINKAGYTNLEMYLSDLAGDFKIIKNNSLMASADTDQDGIADNIDNCTLIANTDQRDTDGDGFGNQCDADLDNNGAVSFNDLNLFRARFGTSDQDADFDGNGSVSFADLDIFRSLFNHPPGPSGISNASPTQP
jgi:hypothetical protein